MRVSAPLLTAALLLSPMARVHAQAVADTSARALGTTRTLDGHSLHRLPVDRIEGALAGETGVESSDDGRLTLRGSTPGEVGTWIDGIPVSPGLRLTAWPGTLAPFSLSTRLTTGTNALDRAAVRTGPLGAALGNAAGGAVLLETARSEGPLNASVSWSTDELSGSGSSLGFNRVEARAGGAIRPGLRLIGTAVLEGQRSREAGHGALEAPLFSQAGLDTTVTYPATPFDPFSDTLSVDVARYAIRRGDCDLYAGSVHAGIATNYGADCDGIRTPFSARSAYQLHAGATFDLSPRTRFHVLALASQRQTRLFDYSLAFHPQALGANRAWSRLFGAQVSHRFGAAGPVLRAALSWQRDAIIEGPLTPAGELDTRAPAGGFMPGAFDFRYDFESFPINDELIRNYRLNTPGSRRSPYDLENRDQYGFIDQFRDGPYALPGFVEAGGPVGRVTLSRERRIVGQASAEWHPLPHHRLSAGGEFTRYDIDHYSHVLVSQAGSDVFRGKPVRSAVFVEDEAILGDFRLAAGLRYERFDSRASRPEFPRISSAPGFDPADPTAGFIGDGSHDALAPRLAFAYRADDRTALRAGYARQTMLPDLGLVFTGINTDLALGGTAFGGDLDLIRSDLAEIGLTRELGSGIDLDIAIYDRHTARLPEGRIVSRPDPLFGRNQDIAVWRSTGERTTLGGEISVTRRLGRLVHGTLGYAWTRARTPDGNAAAGVRPHAVSGLIALEAPDHWQGAASLLRGTSAWIVARYASGTAYSRCVQDLVNAGTLSDTFCPGLFTGEINGARLPAVKQLDLRITRDIPVGGRTLTLWIDARNLLDIRTVTRVFASTGTTTDELFFNRRWSVDSSLYATEAIRNGAYGGNGDIDLAFGGAAASGCGNWYSGSGQLTPPDCVYLVRAEERFGDGDHVFTLAEQRDASEALLRTAFGEPALTGPGRRLRFGLELAF